MHGPIPRSLARERDVILAASAVANALGPAVGRRTPALDAARAGEYGRHGRIRGGKGGGHAGDQHGDHRVASRARLRRSWAIWRILGM